LKLYSNELDVSIDVDEVLMDELSKIGAKYSPKEYGGFLVGHYDDDYKTVYITNYVLPLKYENTSISFKREAEGLENIFKELYGQNPSQYYIGEWHTHPNGISKASSLDRRALNKIAEDESTPIENPIMLIIGYQGNNVSFSFYVSANQKLYEYGRK